MIHDINNLTMVLSQYWQTKTFRINSTHSLFLTHKKKKGFCIFKVVFKKRMTKTLDGPHKAEDIIYYLTLYKKFTNL